MSDFISRQAAIDALRTHERKASKKWFDNQLDIEWNNAIDICCYDIEDLPSAQPETAKRIAETAQNVSDEDLISRKAAIDAIRASTSKYTGFMEMEMYTDDDAVEAIEALPSAQPYTDAEIQKIQGIEQAQFDKIRELAYQDGKADAMRWIPCSERLPEPDERVLVYTVANEYHVWDATPYRGDGYEWEDEEGLYHGLYEVEMWLTLPEPYAERRQNG